MKRALIAVALAAAIPQMVQAAKHMPVTAAEQAELTPQEVLEVMMDGNKRYVAGKLSKPNIKASIKASASGQYPQALVLSCLDSRVPVEWVFDQGIGDIFVGRVAGNVATIDQLGSMEFATKVAGTKLILVLGHEACGAVKGACDGVEMGNLTALLKKIQPAVEAVEGFAPKDRNSKDAAFVEAVVEENVRQTVAEIRRVSPLLAEMEQKGDILIVGALYSLQDGSVKVIE